MQSKWRLVVAMAVIMVLVVAFTIRSGIAHAGSPSANPSSNGYVISNNTPGFIHKAQNLGAIDQSTVMSVTVWLHLHNGAQLDAQVHNQYAKGSSQYHQWLTQDQFNATYSPTSQEIHSVENFLSAHNLTVLTVAENNFYVKVQGTAGDIQKAFHVQINNYSLNGNTYFSNASDPNINDPSGAHVAAISGLDDLGFQPMVAYPSTPDGTNFQPIAVGSQPNGTFFSGTCFFGTQTKTFTNSTTSATYTGNRYGTDITSGVGNLPPCGYNPAEMRTAYNMNPLYSKGLDGTGQTVVITDAFGDATIQSDANLFSQIYGLPALTSANFEVLHSPGTVNNPVNNNHISSAGWPDEITLDVEWVHSMAPGAKIVLLIGPNNTSDLDEAINYAVVHHLGNTISNSWSGLEGFGNPAQFIRDNRILEMATAEGVDVNFSSGDSGDNQLSVGFKTVGFPGSSPFATAIGGTSLATNSDNTMSFQTGWGTNLTKLADKTALGSPPLNPPVNFGFQFGAGGGTSLTFAKPAFQNNLPGSMRLVPDVSMLADPYTGVEIIETVNGVTGVGVIGGTSLACPMFSAMMAIAAQQANHPLGQAAPLMYQLSSATSTTSPLYDVTPVTSATNVTGSITASSVTTSYSADQLAGPLDGTSQYISALYNSPFSTRWFTLTFGTDSSLTTATGWDNVTGVGTPNGVYFVNAVAGL